MIIFNHTIKIKENQVGWLEGDCLEKLLLLPDNSIACCVTSPPYFNLRDYGNAKQIGLEKTPDLYIESLVKVFREVKRILKQDGTLWLNLGDSYWSGKSTDKLKAKDLIGIPWEVAFALRKDGWYLRQDIIWHKPNPMPESVKNRCTSAHEYVFLLAKSDKYFFDHKAIAVPADPTKWGIPKNGIYTGKSKKDYEGSKAQVPSGIKQRLAAKLLSGEPVTRNAHSVWSITKPSFQGNHCAVMPNKLAEQCLLAGSKEGDWILDPFGGSGTTAIAAIENKRNSILIELNPEFIETAKKRFEDYLQKEKPIIVDNDLFKY
jgi:DNA modification methylase